MIAGTLIGGGLFLGLRNRPAIPPSTASTGRAAVEDPSRGAPSPDGESAAARTAAAKASAAPTPSKSKLAEQAAAAIDVHRAMLVKKCWEPAVKASPTPATINYVFTITFDAEGNQIMRGIVEDRITGRPTVTACVTQSLPLLQIPPPGEPATVEVPFHLP